MNNFKKMMNSIKYFLKIGQKTEINEDLSVFEELPKKEDNFQQMVQHLSTPSTFVTKLMGNPLIATLKKTDDSQFIQREDFVVRTPSPNFLSPAYFSYDDYIKDYTSQPNCEYIESNFAKVNTPLTSLEHKQTFESFINSKNFLNQRNLPILSKIHHDLAIIVQSIEPLQTLGCNLSVSLVGGSVRDFVLNKPITDLDIMIGFNDMDPSLLKPKFYEQLVSAGFNDAQLDRIGMKESLDETPLNQKKLKTKLIELCFLKDIQKVFYHEDQSGNDPLNPEQHTYSNNLNERIDGVIKLKNDKKLNFEVDLLLTNFTTPDFLHGFDINLCKASFCLVNKEFNMKFPLKPTHLISRFSARLDFFADIRNKKLTIDVNKFTQPLLDLVINKHLVKITKKYPDFSVNFISHSKSDELLKYANSTYLVQELQKNLSTKEKPYKKVKV